MKHRRAFIFLVAAILVLAGVLLLAIRRHEAIDLEHGTKHDGNYTYINGTVTAYDVTPTYTDGGIIFQIDGTAVDIGGGLRPANEIGEVYGPIHIGDKVKAKLISPEHGYLTVYNCADCYVKKQ